MQLQYAVNPVWANAEHTAINLTIRWVGWNEDLPFSAVATDSEQHGRDIYAAAVAGQFGAIAEYVAPPAPPPPGPPTSVTMRQARLALLGAGLLSQVDAALSAIADPVQRQAAQIDWEYAATVDRSSPLVANLAASLNLDAATLDTLFTTAATL